MQEEGSGDPWDPLPPHPDPDFSVGKNETYMSRGSPMRSSVLFLCAARPGGTQGAFRVPAVSGQGWAGMH